MLGHVSFGVRDLGKAMRFYDAALGALGFERVWTSIKGAGYGAAGGPDRLAIFTQRDTHPPGPGFHLALAAPNRAGVDAFHAAALDNGGRDEGPPGPRPHYGSTYYAAFVLDPDGHKLEAVHQ